MFQTLSQLRLQEFLLSPFISLAKVPVLTRLREKRRPPPLRIVEAKEGESGADDQVDQMDNQLVLGLAGLRLETTPPCSQASVQEGGFVRLALSHGVTVDVTPEQAFRVSNPFQESSIAISSCGRQIAFVHPAGWQFGKQQCQVISLQGGCCNMGPE